MNHLQYDNQWYWRTGEHSALRPDGPGHLKVLIIEPNGTIQCTRKPASNGLWQAARDAVNRKEAAAEDSDFTQTHPKSLITILNETRFPHNVNSI